LQKHHIFNALAPENVMCFYFYMIFSVNQYIVHSYQYGVVLCCFFCNLIPFLLVLALRIQAANWKSEQF